jgi:hypothetical protein
MCSFLIVFNKIYIKNVNIWKNIFLYKFGYLIVPK